MPVRLPWQILVAIVLAVAIGYFAGDASIGGIGFNSIFDLLGTLFLSALRMLIIPLVATSVMIGVASARASGGLGRLGLRACGSYLATTLSAILIGVLLVNAFQPGIVHGKSARDLLDVDAASADLASEITDKGYTDLLDLVLSVIPANVISAAASDDMLGIIFFSLLFGYFMSRLEPALGDPLLRVTSGVFRVMMRITELVMMFAPIGVFGLVARAVSRTGLSVAGPLLDFMGVVLLALTAHSLITLPVILRVFARVSPLSVYRAVSPALLTAFSTASSAATLPATLECVEHGVGVSNRVSSFVLPLGTAVNMNGTALYECVAALFLAQAYGLHVGMATQFTVVVIGLVTSFGVPGVPSASLVGVAIIVNAIGLPIEAIGVLIAVDRLLDMTRTAVNVLGDAVCGIMVARLEGETGLLGSRAAGSDG